MKQQGFTVMEVMIVVAIIGLLAAIAYPNYTSYVRRAKIQGAISALASQRFSLEQYYQNNRNYGTVANACPASISMPTVDSFSVTCSWGSSADDQSYLLTATGTGGMVGFTYTQNEQNQQQTTAFIDPSTNAQKTGLPTNCWLTKGNEC
ncbi:MAG: type IV pilin protein [Formivibrio sp.]|nr:type IV pilin protein [Formivibrio sp.]